MSVATVNLGTLKYTIHAIYTHFPAYIVYIYTLTKVCKYIECAEKDNLKKYSFQ